jgi:hypothetical protein
MSKQTMTQYSVLVPNEPGKIAKLTQMLSKEDVCMTGMRTMSMGEMCSIQFTVEKAGALQKKLENAGYPCCCCEVYQFEMPNTPNELNKLCKSLADENINILSLYGTSEGPNVRVVLSVDQMEQAAPVVAKMCCNS